MATEIVDVGSGLRAVVGVAWNVRQNQWVASVSRFEVKTLGVWLPTEVPAERLAELTVRAIGKATEQAEKRKSADG